MQNDTPATGTHGGARPNTGGAREGAGRPRKDAPPTQLQSAHLELAVEKAAHERVKREQRELQVRIEMGEYVARDAVSAASAHSMAMVANALRSVPDHLERTGVAAEVCAQVEAAIESAMADLAASMKLFAAQTAST